MGKLGNKTLKKGLWKNWRTGFSVWCFFIGIIKLVNLVKDNLCGIAKIYAWWVSTECGLILNVGCFENGNFWYVGALQSFHIWRQYLSDGVLYELLGFVGSYDLERCALLLYFYNFVVLEIKVDCCVGYVFLVVPLVLGLYCLVKYRMRLVWLIVFLLYSQIWALRNCY